jgi:hypothetical protein
MEFSSAAASNINQSVEVFSWIRKLNTHLHIVSVESDMVFLFQTSMNVMTLQWLLDVLQMLNAVTYQHTSYANVNLASKVMERWNVEVNSISTSDYTLCHKKKIIFVM